MPSKKRVKCSYKTPIAVIIAGFSISIWLGLKINAVSESLQAARFAQLAEQVEAKITSHFDSYFDTLRANAAFYVNSGEFTQAQWGDYVSRLNIKERFPGILGFGFIHAYNQAESDQYVADIRATRLPEFQITSLNKAFVPEENFIITHIEPLKSNFSAIGLNLATEDNRRNGILETRRTHHGTITDRIELVQEESARTSYLLLYPIMQANPVGEDEPITVWSYAPFSGFSFFQKALVDNSKAIDITVFDGNERSLENLIYQSHRSDINSSLPESAARATTVELGGKSFTIVWEKGDAYIGHQSSTGLIAGLGLALGSLLGAAIIFNTRNLQLRANRIADQKTDELLQVNYALEQEIVERQNAEETAHIARKLAETANTIKDDFLATVSHEIRTPMNSIIGFTELLDKSKLTNEQMIWTSHVRNSGHALLRIINDILNLSKIESGNLDLETLPISLEKVLKEALESLTATAAEKALTLEFKVEGVLPKLVVGDEIRINQMIINLVGNSIKFTEKGFVRLTTSWSGSSVEGTALIRIEDTGIGIEADNIERLFDKFTQADTSTTRRFGGTGLGLAITKKIIDLMGGSVKVESEVNKGTTFLISIPFEVAAPAKETHAVLPAARTFSKAPFEPASINILVVDDNLVNLKLASTILGQLGCTVDSASNGAMAIEKVKNDHFDVIFMDCQMPIMNGFDATTEIRRLEKDGGLQPTRTKRRRTIIVALTADATDNIREQCEAVEMDHYMLKPCKIDDFKYILNLHIEDFAKRA